MFKDVKIYNRRFKPTIATRHATERQERINTATRLIKAEKATVYMMFDVDNGHKNGNEIHILYTNGIVFIYNKDTGRFITVLIARCGQIKNYFTMAQIQRNSTIKNMLDMAENHRQNNFNNLY